MLLNALVSSQADIPLILRMQESEALSCTGEKMVQTMKVTSA